MRALVLAFVLASCATPDSEWPVPLTERDILCGGLGGAMIDDDDPGLALFKEGNLQDRKVALAIERTNSCDDEEQPWFCEDYPANDETPVEGCIHEPRGKPR